MQASKLKASLITVCCFVIALCSEIRCMDNASDFQEATSSKSKNTNSEGFLDSLKTEMGNDSSRSWLILSQNKNKPSQTWTSYISYPIKTAIDGAYNIVDFTVKHPTQTIITSLVIAAQFTAVAADCNCILYTGDTKPYNGNPISYGQFPNETACESLANTFQGYSYYGCV